MKTRKGGRTPRTPRARTPRSVRSPKEWWLKKWSKRLAIPVAVLATYLAKGVTGKPGVPQLQVVVQVEPNPSGNPTIAMKNLYYKLVQGNYTQNGYVNGKPRYENKGVILKYDDKWRFVLKEKELFYAKGTFVTPAGIHFYFDGQPTSIVVNHAQYPDTRRQIY